MYTEKPEKQYDYTYSAMLMCDFYKLSHYAQYPNGTETIYSTWVPRTSRDPRFKEIVAFGYQAFIKEFLIDFFNVNFFSRPKEVVIAEYVRVIRNTLNDPLPFTKHIEELHDLGYLPLRIRAVREGTLVPIRVPMLTVQNTKKEFFWLTNFIETIMSNQIWLPSTSATIAHEYKKLLTKYALLTGGDVSFVNFQGHDFSMRGMGESGASKTSGAAHLTSFMGTDTVPAILFLEQYYNANIEKELVGTSIPATEHSVMCANGKDERKVISRLINEVYPNGLVSIVSDTWDFWHLVTTVYPSLKEDIMARDGSLKIRPDSGDPVLILIGDPNAETEHERKGLIECLWDTFGGTINEKGYKELDSHIGAVYGDSITLERCEAISKGLMDKGFASTNAVYGIGSFSYQYNTRDTFGFAMKATYAVINGEEIQIYKDPKTDSGMKKSNKGLVVVVNDAEHGIICIDGLNQAQQFAIQDVDMLEDVFFNGKLLRDQSLADIRELIAQTLN